MVLKLCNHFLEKFKIFFLEYNRTQKPSFSVFFSWYKRVSISLFVFFQNKIVESIFKYQFSETYIEKFHKYQHWKIGLESLNRHISYVTSRQNQPLSRQQQQHHAILHLAIPPWDLVSSLSPIQNHQLT